MSDLAFNGWQLEIERLRRRLRYAYGTIAALVVSTLGGGAFGMGHMGAQIAYADSLADAALDSVAIMRAHRERQEATYTAALAATEDSVRTWRERAESLRAEADSFRARADEVATELVATLSAEQAALFGSYSARRDSVEVVLVRQRDDARSEAREWRARHDDVRALYAALERETARQRDVIASLESGRRIRDAALAAKDRRVWTERAVAVLAVGVLILR